MYGVRDGVPTFAGYYHQREHGQHARKYRQETRDLAADACEQRSYIIIDQIRELLKNNLEI